MWKALSLAFLLPSLVDMVVSVADQIRRQAYCSAFMKEGGVYRGCVGMNVMRDRNNSIKAFFWVLCGDKGNIYSSLKRKESIEEKQDKG
ncbi:MAG: hypothetical protein JOS17DRAFT_729800 [Linnemannia elongata]|nr:MAG: hypothetical protein JOS17DRAFT_729800 [Linnemannia elongata]